MEGTEITRALAKRLAEQNDELRAENAHLDAALADTAAQLTDAVHRAQEAEHNYGLLAKQADAFHAENARLREQLRKARITTVAASTSESR